jgi:DNA replication and repair protein RecF
MYLKNLSLINFKNYVQADLVFSPDVNCFTGLNGEGKTNLLDAIYYLSFTKSFFNAIDSQNILHDAPFFLIQGEFVNNETVTEIYCGQKRNQKKIVKKNKKEYERLADHIGLFPCVMISPSDNALIYEGSEERRKFMDSILSQYNRNYLEDLISYNKVLLQRNALLKQFRDNGTFDAASLEIWDEQLVEYGARIYEVRKDFVAGFIQLFNEHYKFISGQAEKVSLQYESPLHHGSFSELLKIQLRKDRMLGYTASGIHKDDLLFKLGDHPIRKFGSQGQQKSFLLSLRLTQFDILKKEKNVLPILLLDDIYDKLDDQRIKKLMELVSGNNFGQLFITDTNASRIQNLFSHMDVDLQVFKVENGNVNAQSHVAA